MGRRVRMDTTLACGVFTACTETAGARALGVSGVDPAIQPISPPRPTLYC